MAFGCEVEVIQANNTTQVNNYDRFDFSEGTAEAKKAWKDAHWEEDLQQCKPGPFVWKFPAIRCLARAQTPIPTLPRDAALVL